MKNLFYLAGMFTLVLSPVNCSYDTENLSTSKDNTTQVQNLTTSTTDIADDHEPILKPTKP